MNPGHCRKCGHQFSPGDPDTCWCPGCGELYTAGVDDPPAEIIPGSAEEVAEARRERVKWRVWFWFFFLLGPVLSLFLLSMGPRGFARLPAWMRYFMNTWEMPLLGILGAAGAAGFCLAKLRVPRRQLGLQLLFAFAMALIILFVYAGIFLFGCFLVIQNP